MLALGICLFARDFDYDYDDEDDDEEGRIAVNAGRELGSVGKIELEAALPDRGSFRVGLVR